MRVLLAIVLLLAAAPSYAACEPMRPSNWGEETLAQSAYAACLQAELARRSIEDQRLAQLRTEYELRVKLLEMQLQQQLQLRPLPPILPAF
jgi:hypothetical protein